MPVNEPTPTPTVPVDGPTPTPTVPANEPTPTPQGPDVTPTPYVPETTPTPETPEPTATPEEPEPEPFRLIPTPEPEQTVLGANRVREKGAVLGAKRGADQAVLGKRRRPATGDSMAIIIWVIALGAAVGGVLTSLIAMWSNKNKNK